MTLTTATQSFHMTLQSVTYIIYTKIQNLVAKGSRVTGSEDRHLTNMENLNFHCDLIEAEDHIQNFPHDILAVMMHHHTKLGCNTDRVSSSEETGKQLVSSNSLTPSL